MSCAAGQLRVPSVVLRSRTTEGTLSKKRKQAIRLLLQKIEILFCTRREGGEVPSVGLLTCVFRRRPPTRDARPSQPFSGGKGQ